MAAHYNGKPCRHGHGTLRYRNDDRCVRCCKIKSGRQEHMRRIIGRGRKTPEHFYGSLSAARHQSEVPPLTDFLERKS